MNNIVKEMKQVPVFHRATPKRRREKTTKRDHNNSIKNAKHSQRKPEKNSKATYLAPPLSHRKSHTHWKPFTFLAFTGGESSA